MLSAFLQRMAQSAHKDSLKAVDVQPVWSTLAFAVFEVFLQVIWH
jgi:hypothetical protein